MIEVSHLTKAYGRRTVIDDLTFRVSPGVVTGLLGPAGAGKTTTLKLILGLERPSSGSALINGRPYSALERPADTIGAMMDGHWVAPGRRVRGHIFSSGPPRRALGAPSDPDHLLFDEPFAGLTPEEARRTRQTLRRLAAQGKTVLVSGHSVTEMAHVADTLVVLGNGRLVAHSTAEDFFVGGGKPLVRVRAERQAELFDLLTSMGAAVTPRLSDHGVALLVGGLSIGRVADAAVGFGILELVEEDAAIDRALLEVTGMSVPMVGTLARGGIA